MRYRHGVRPLLRLTYANVVSTLCSFLLLGGGAYAAAGVRLSKHSVGPRQLKKGSVTTAKLRKGAVTTAKLRQGAVTGAKIDLDGERLGGHPATDYQLRIQQPCFNGAIEGIGPEGGVICREAIRQISLDQGSGDPVSAVQLGPGLLLQSVCHDGGQVKVVFFNDGGIAGSLNWFASVAGAASADGASIPADGSRFFLYDGSRIEGQFVYPIGVNLATVSLHALDAGASCEVRGAALVVAPEGR